MPLANRTQEQDVTITNVIFNDGTNAGRWWKLFVTAAPASATPPPNTTLNAAVTKSKKKHPYSV